MELRTYITPLLKWWWFLAIAVLLAGGSSYWAVSREPKVYETGTTLLVGRVVTDPDPSGGEFSLINQLANSYVTMANMQPLKDETRKALQIDILPPYSVRQLPNSQLIRITVRDTDPLRAQVVANELANQLVVMSPGARDDDRNPFIEDQLTKLELSIVETEAVLGDTTDQLDEAFSAREIANLQGEVAALQSKLNTLRATYANLLENASPQGQNVLSVIEPAPLSRQPVAPDIPRTVMVTTFVGLVLAVGTILLVEYLDDSIQGVEDIEKLGTQALPAIPLFEDTESGSSLITHDDPLSPVSDSFRALRTSIYASFKDHALHTLLVSSAKPGDGKSVTAANLAITMAQGGRRVILVEGDLRKPKQHVMFEVPNRRGLADLLQVRVTAAQTGDTTPKPTEYLQPSREVSGLFLMTGGRQINEVALRLLSSDTMRELIAELAEEFDVVVLDSSPVLYASDAVVQSTQVDAVVIVADAATSRRRDVSVVLNRFRAVHANVLGIVLNRVDVRSSDYYSYYEETSPRQRGGRKRLHTEKKDTKAAV